MSKTKSCIIDCPNELPRFIGKYISGNALSQNQFAEQVNSAAREITGEKNLTLISIPKDLQIKSNPKLSGNSAIRKWYKKKPATRPADYRIRMALCKVLGITYLETFFVTKEQIRDYLIQLCDELPLLFARAARRSLKNPVILNRYNIASYLAEDKEAKNYWNIDNLIQQTITTAEDIEEYHIRKHKKGEKPATVSFEEIPQTFLEYSLTNLYIMEEKSLKTTHMSYEMLMMLAVDFKKLFPGFKNFIKFDSDNLHSPFNLDYIWNFFKIRLIISNKNEGVNVCTVGIELLTLWIKRVDQQYIKLLEQLKVPSDFRLSVSREKQFLDSENLNITFPKEKEDE